MDGEKCDVGEKWARLLDAMTIMPRLGWAFRPTPSSTRECESVFRMQSKIREPFSSNLYGLSILSDSLKKFPDVCVMSE